MKLTNTELRGLHRELAYQQALTVQAQEEAACWKAYAAEQVKRALAAEAREAENTIFDGMPEPEGFPVLPDSDKQALGTRKRMEYR